MGVAYVINTTRMTDANITLIPILSHSKTRKNHLAEKIKRHRKTQSWKGFNHDISNTYDQPKLDFSNLTDTEIADQIQPQQKLSHVCVHCQSHLYVFDDEGISGCSNPQCARLCAKSVDQSPEWRYFGADDTQSGDPARCGMPTNELLKESSMGCVVSNSLCMSYEMRKIKKYATWHSMPHNEKILNDDFHHIECMSKLAGIPKLIIDDAKYFHKQISEHETSFRGSNRDGVLGSSIYISCTVNNYPRTPNEISEIFNFDKSSVTKGCKDAIKIINDIERDLPNDEKIVFNTSSPVVFMPRYCSKLKMTSKMTKLCEFVAIKIEKMNLMPENVSYSIAAGIIYFISVTCKLNIHKRDIYLVTNISEVTINKCFKKIEAYKHDVLPGIIIRTYS